MFLIFLGVGMVIVGQWMVSLGKAPAPGRGQAMAGLRPMAGAARAAPAIAPVRQTAMTGKQGEFARAALGAAITYQHPQRGARTGLVLGTIRYTELWQKRKDPSEPWVPTGNLFTAHWLGDTLLYEWKGNLFLLDGYDPLTDAEIKEHILPHAQRFGQSDETAEVSFAYPPASWRVFDIGKFRVDEVTGQGLRLSAGAVGRFVHAQGNTGNEGQLLVVEDYLEGGGGQDTAWLGWRITWDDLIKIA